MTRKLLYHGLWIAVALAAYGLGRLQTQQETPIPVAAPSIPPAKPSLLGDDSPQNSERAPGRTDAPDPGAKSPESGSTALSAASLDALAREALNDPNPVKRNLAFSKLLESLTPENALAVMEALRQGNAGGDQWRLFRYAWGAVDGKGALAEAAQIEDEGRRREATGEILSGWASADPQDAIAWLSTIENPEERQRFEGSLVSGLADHDIGIATGYALGVAAQDERRAAGYIEMVAQEQLRKEGLQGGLRWIETLPDGAVKGSALDRVAGAYVREDPAAAAAWAQRYAGQDFGVRAVEEVGDEWAESDPAAATSWLSSLPDGQGKAEGMESAMGEWVQRDPLAASQYLAEMPESGVRDSAVSGFSRRLAWEDPEAAITWAGTISQEELRLRTLTRAGQAWYRRDADAAAAWLSTSGLPPEAQQAVLNPERRGRR